MKHLTAFTLILSTLFLGCSKSSTTPNTPPNTPTTATFTLGSTGGDCTGAVLAGTYNAGTALTSANTATINVNVTVVGSYSISTNTVNGISFSDTGSFVSTGSQTVILAGKGTPTAATTNNFTVTAGSNSCEFSVPVTATIPPAGDYITCDINGVATTFNIDASASNYATESNTPPYHASGLAAGGNSLYATNPQLAFGVSNTNNTGLIAAGTYTNTGFSMGFDYTDASSNSWAIGSSSSPTFTIIVTYIDAYNVQGTFSGTLKNNLGTGSTSMAITNGEFNLPVYN
jgi:hypothetical protein